MQHWPFGKRARTARQLHLRPNWTRKKAVNCVFSVRPFGCCDDRTETSTTNCCIYYYVWLCIFMLNWINKQNEWIENERQQTAKILKIHYRNRNDWMSTRWVASDILHHTNTDTTAPAEKERKTVRMKCGMLWAGFERPLNRATLVLNKHFYFHRKFGHLPYPAGQSLCCFSIYLDSFNAMAPHSFRHSRSYKVSRKSVSLCIHATLRDHI